MPERTCIVCRRKEDMPPKRQAMRTEGELQGSSRQQRDGQSELVRLVVVGRAVVLDRERKLPGRGAYVHTSATCSAKLAQVAKIARALRRESGEVEFASVKEVVAELLGASHIRSSETDRDKAEGSVIPHDSVSRAPVGRASVGREPMGLETGASTKGRDRTPRSRGKVRL